MIVLGSVHGSPGATTSACGLAAALAAADPSRRVLLVEADPDGGVLAARCAGLRADRTLVDLAADARRSLEPDDLARLTQQLWGQVGVVVGPPSGEESCSALRTGAERLASALRFGDGVTVVDVGRLRPDSPAFPFVREADLVLVVCAPSFEQVAVAEPRAAGLARGGARLGVVCVGDGPYPPGEVAAALAAPLAATLPWDPRATARFAAGAASDRRLRASLWWRSLAALADTVDPPPATAIDGADTVHTRGGQ